MFYHKNLRIIKTIFAKLSYVLLQMEFFFSQTGNTQPFSEGGIQTLPRSPGCTREKKTSSVTSPIPFSLSRNYKKKYFVTT